MPRRTNTRHTPPKGAPRNTKRAKSDVCQTWQSVSEFCNEVANRENYITQSPRDPWSGNLTSEEAVEVARAGWPEGVQAVREAARKLPPVKPQESDGSELYFDVCGDEWDMARVIADEPESAYCYSQTETAKIITLFYSVSFNQSYSAEQITAKGAQVAALVEMLETSGTRVNCYICFKSKSHRSNTSEFISYFIQFKSADQPLTLDTAAFAMTHPAMLRKLMCAQVLEDGHDPAETYPAYIHASDAKQATGETAPLIINGNDDILTTARNAGLI